jgi:hypothetical protein
VNAIKMLLNGQAAKALVALASFATILVTTQYPHATWEPAVIGGINFLLTFLVPNAKAPEVAPKSGG